MMHFFLGEEKWQVESKSVVDIYGRSVRANASYSPDDHGVLVVFDDLVHTCELHQSVESYNTGR